jgi:fatty acid desaturase
MTSSQVVKSVALEDLGGIAKSDLVSGDGVSYADFRRSLRPNRLRIFCDLLLGYAFLAAIAWVAMVAADNFSSVGLIVAVVLAAVSFGYWMAYLQLFIHEAAHFNLVASRAWNDLLANALIGIWVGASIAHYRKVHWEHHRSHGTPDDSEHTYFAGLTFAFIFKAMTGIHALRVLLFRHQTQTNAASVPEPGAPARGGMLIGALLLHVCLIVLLCVFGQWPVAVAWLAGMGMFFPFFGALRQLLEHRSAVARKDVDYSKVHHGRTTRLFAAGPVGSTFGAAGFRRHLLHHWDPGVSYTNLRELETHLRSCDATRDHIPQKTTYLRAFWQLYGR